MHVPKELHDDSVRKGHDAAWLFAFYARRCAAIPAGDKITVNDFTFWRAALKAELGAAPPSVTETPPARAPSTGGDEAQPADNVWTQVLPRIESKVNRSLFYTWFRETELIADDGDVITVAKPGAKSDLFADWLGKHYHGLVHEVMAEVRPGTRVRFVVVDEARRKYG